MSLNATIHWKPNAVASWVHTAWRATMAGGRAPTSVRDAAMAMPPLDGGWPWLRRKAASANQDWESFVGQFDSADSPQLAHWLRTVHHALSDWQPRLVDGLDARVRPLREQWEARAPGFLKRLSTATGIQADIALELSLVTPAFGGFGEPHLSSTSPRATMEAVLYHPAPQIPEPVRIGWLVLQWAIRGTSANRNEALEWLAEAARHVEWTNGEPADPRWQQAWLQHWLPPE